ncbi:MAG TPA: Lrp/AsnC family transcriptional regulator, partial [Thermomicrobiales bacterium]|nr:Lrp/AsnC family transcriptional regulator [Thermomicrobiales bacterium]
MSRHVSTTDRMLIRLLQQNARMSFAELSRITGIPESTVRRRIERLQDRGIIRFAMIADAEQLGFEISAMIGLRIDISRLDEIGQMLLDRNEVVFASFLTGSYDIIAQVLVETQAALVALLKEFATIEGVRS